MFVKKNLYGIKLLLLALFFSGIIISNAYAEDTCVDCHKDSKFRVQNKVLFDYYDMWKDSVHGLSGVTCVDCHGGNPNKADKKASHKKGFSSPRVLKEKFYKNIPQTCGSAKCHSDVLKNFTGSKHYKALNEKGKGPHCATCHGSVNSDVYYTSIIARTCEACHNEETEIHPEVTELAEKILQRINVSRGYKRWITIYYGDKKPKMVKELDTLYKDVADSWHQFDFAQVDEKSQELLNKLKSTVNRGLIEKKKMKQEK